MAETYLREKEAAKYLKVSLRHFQDVIRPRVTRMDFAKDDARRPMWRYSVSNLDGYASSRRLVA